MSRCTIGMLAGLLIFCVTCMALAPTYAAAKEVSSGIENESEAKDPCLSFNRLNTLVRDRRIDRAAARQELLRLLPAIKAYYYANGGRDHDRSEWIFPLAGYSARAIAGGRRHGYEPRGYDWYDGNSHGGHPALDIFIRDRNRDDLDDRTGVPVPVLAMTGGIVVALEKEWSASSTLRGGKYLWVYDPSAEALVYYAHNRELTVGLGDIVKPGDPIAFVGRTGLNAARKRSPTHLHLTYLTVNRDGTLTPQDPYPFLLRSATKNNSRGAKPDVSPSLSVTSFPPPAR